MIGNSFSRLGGRFFSYPQLMFELEFVLKEIRVNFPVDFTSVDLFKLANKNRWIQVFHDHPGEYFVNAFIAGLDDLRIKDSVWRLKCGTDGFYIYEKIDEKLVAFVPANNGIDVAMRIIIAGRQ